MLGTDTESSPSRTGLVAQIARPRRKKRKAQVASSQHSTASNEGENEKHGRLRATLDSAVDKIKTRTSSDNRHESDSDGMLKADSRGLQGILHRAKEKIKPSHDSEQQVSDDAGRGRSAKNRELLESHVGSASSSRSLSTKHTNHSESSLVTYGSESES